MEGWEGCRGPGPAGGWRPDPAPCPLTPALSLLSLVPSPRKPSFPFQWAWESFTTDGRALHQPSFTSALGHQALPLPPAVHHRKSRRKSTAALPEAHGFCWKTDRPNLERRPRLRSSSCTSIPPGRGTSQELELPGEAGLQSPRESSRSGSEPEESEPEGPGAEEAERDLIPGELPQLPRRGLILEELQFSEATEEAEDGERQAPRRRRTSSRRKEQNSGEQAWDESEVRCLGSVSSSTNLRGPQRRKPRAQELEGPWDLEKLQRQLQQELDCGESRGSEPRFPTKSLSVQRGWSQRPEPGIQTWPDRASGAGRDRPRGQGGRQPLTCPSADRPRETALEVFAGCCSGLQLEQEGPRLGR